MSKYCLTFVMFLVLTIVKVNCGNLTSQQNKEQDVGRNSWFSYLHSWTLESQEPKFKECSPEPRYGKLMNLKVIPCDGTGDCPLIRGTNTTLDLEFVSKIPANHLILNLSGVLGWFMAAFGSGEVRFLENMCENGIQCPIQVGKIYKYQKSIYIHPNIPEISLNVKVKISDDQRHDIACAMIPVKIQ